MTRVPTPVPSILGMELNEAARLCRALGIDFKIENQSEVDQWQAAQSAMRVVQQRPGLGIETTQVEVWVALRHATRGVDTR